MTTSKVLVVISFILLTVGVFCLFVNTGWAMKYLWGGVWSYVASKLFP